jgi:hypothetical protein
MYNFDFSDEPMTEQEVISILGNGYKTNGAELTWRCPACPGGDKHGDNLKYNKNKQILKCFACDFAQEITGIIARRRYEAKGSGLSNSVEYSFQRQPAQPHVETPKKKEIEQADLVKYYLKCHHALMRNKDILRKMYEKHSIMPKTAVRCNIGYDGAKDMLVFPSIAVGKDPTDYLLDLANGAEYREHSGDKLIRRISGYDPKICKVYSREFVMYGIICEGYKDAYNLIQIMQLTDPERLSCTAIFTVQNGTGSINTDNCLQKVNWYRFESIGLLMDEDEAGDKATAIAQELFPKMVDLRPEMLGGYSDIEERFRKQFGKNVDIEKALSSSLVQQYSEGR